MDNDTITIIVFSVILLLVSSLCLWQFRRARKTLANARYLETATIGDVEQSLYDMQSLEGDSYKHYCELNGEIKTDNPISTIFEQRECLWYSGTITENYRRLEQKRNSKGETTSQWVSRTRILGNYSDSAVNYIEDETSQNRLFVDSDNNFDVPVTFNYVATAQNDELVHKFNLRFVRSASERTKSFQFNECSLAPNSQVYMLGDAYYDEEHFLHLGNTHKAGAIGIVTTKSEEEVIKGFHKKSIIWIVCAVVSFGLSATILISCFLNR